MTTPIQKEVLDTINALVLLLENGSDGFNEKDDVIRKAKRTYQRLADSAVSLTHHAHPNAPRTFLPKSVSDLLRILSIEARGNFSVGISQDDHEGDIGDLRIQIIEAEGTSLVEFLYPAPAAPSAIEQDADTVTVNRSDLLNLLASAPGYQEGDYFGRPWLRSIVALVGTVSHPSTDAHRAGCPSCQMQHDSSAPSAPATDSAGYAIAPPATVNDEIKEEAQAAVDASNNEVALAIDRFTDRICEQFDRLIAASTCSVPGHGGRS